MHEKLNSEKGLTLGVLCSGGFPLDGGFTLGSLFDGSGGFPLAGVLAGIRPIWASEIEPFCVRVEEKRFPDVKHYGDVSKLSGADLPPVDIITFGSPCQDMSIAGRRAGLDGERSGLFHEAIRIIKEMREETHGQYPKYAIWENVKGAFSSNNGEDFRSVLEAFCHIKDTDVDVPMPEKGKWPNAGLIMGDDYSIAWRVFNTCGWGIPQRRERIYLVADFADERAGEVLFKPESVSWHTPEGFRKGEEVAGHSGEGTQTAGGFVLNDQGGSVMSVSEDVTGTLRAQEHGHQPIVAAVGFCTEHSAKARGIGYEEEKSPTLRAGTVPAALLFENHSQDSRYTGPHDVAQSVTARYGTGGNNQPFVVEPKAFGICSKTSHGMLGDNPDVGFYEAETSRCLDQGSGGPTRNQGGMVVVEGNGSRPSHKGDGYRESEIMYTLNATEQHAVAFADKAAPLSAMDGPKGPSSQQLKNPEQNFVGEPIYHSSKAGYHTNFSDDPAVGALVATDYKDPPTVTVYHSNHASGMNADFKDKEAMNALAASDHKDPPTVCEEPEYIVRRLTPTECLRLQGLPDWWCDDLADPEPTDEEVDKWMDIFEEYRQAVTHAKTPKTRAQVIKWLKDPYSDSAVYKMAGNGVSIPIPYFILSSIAEANKLPEAPAQSCETYPLE